MYTQDRFVVDFTYRFAQVESTAEDSTMHMDEIFHTEDFFRIEMDL